MADQPTEPDTITTVKHGIRMSVSAAQYAVTIIQERYSAFTRLTHQEKVEPEPAEIEAYEKWLAQFKEVLEAGGKWADVEWDYARYSDGDDIQFIGLNPPVVQIVTVEDETVQEFHNRVDEAYMYYAEHGEWPADTRPSGGFYARFLHDAEWYDWKRRIGDELERLL